MTDELLAGRYQLEQELGRGEMATVFLATDLLLSRRVAVKVMRPGSDDGLAERFRREAGLAASLKHPNVLEVHDFGEDAVRGPFLVREWVRGESLRELAKRLAPVPAEVAALLGWELARALEAAHALGVVHRDVRPEHVLVPSGGPLKLADFGATLSSGPARQAGTGALAYRAPECLDGGAGSPASDVYSVGVILFELCTGTAPRADNGALKQDAPSLCEAAPGTPEPFGALVDRCLSLDSRARPVNGEALAASLDAVVRQLAGPPAEVSRQFFLEQEATAARWREAWFQRLLERGRALLAEGEGAKAARLLDEALRLEPGAPEVLALRPRRRRAGRVKVLGGSALLLGAVWLLSWRTSRPEVPLQLPEVQAAKVQAPDIDQTEPAPFDPPSPPPSLTRSRRTKTPVGEVPHQRTSAPAAGASLEPPAPPRFAAPASTLTAPRPPLPPATTEKAPSSEVAPIPPPREPARSEVQGYATLKVATRPWAEVFVDGKSRGYTPRVSELRLSPGAHRVRFENPLCDALEEELHVNAGETLSRELTLPVRQAEVIIFAPQGARVAIDGVDVGVAPLREPVKLTHGSHVLTARGASGEELRRELDVVAGERTEVELEAGP